MSQNETIFHVIFHFFNHFCYLIRRGQIRSTFRSLIKKSLALSSQLLIIFYYHLKVQNNFFFLFHKIDNSIESRLKSVLVWASRGSLMTTRQFFFYFVSFSKKLYERVNFFVSLLDGAERVRQAFTRTFRFLFFFFWSLFTEDLPLLLTREPLAFQQSQISFSKFFSSPLQKCYQILTTVSFINGTSFTLVSRRRYFQFVFFFYYYF